jgi:hypothetical protein
LLQVGALCFDEALHLDFFGPASAFAYHAWPILAGARQVPSACSCCMTGSSTTKICMVFHQSRSAADGQQRFCCKLCHGRLLHMGELTHRVVLLQLDQHANRARRLRVQLLPRCDGNSSSVGASSRWSEDCCIVIAAAYFSS